MQTKLFPKIYILFVSFFLSVLSLNANNSTFFSFTNFNEVHTSHLIFSKKTINLNSSFSYRPSFMMMDPNAFITRWDTRNSNPVDTTNADLAIPTNPAFTYNYTIDWGDGNIDTGVRGNATHTYVTPGEYEVSITGDFPAIYVNNNTNRNKIIDVVQWGSQVWQSFELAFRGASNLNFSATQPPNLTQVTNYSQAFRSASNFNSPLNDWDMSNAIDVSNMFQSAVLFNQPLDNWDLGNVTNMANMFGGATAFNQSLNNWDVSNVTTTLNMFFSALSFNQPLNNWDTSNISVMTNMFLVAQRFNQPLDNWDISNITSMFGMFRSAQSFNQPLGAWDISNITNMSSMLDNTALSKENYDATLIGWAAQNVQSNVPLGADGLTFCDAELQRQGLIDNNGWVITGDAIDCGISCATITAPVNGAVDVATNITITWDAVSAATDYLLRIGTTPGGVDVLNNAPQGNVTSYTPAIAFAEGTTFYATVTPSNSSGIATGCSGISFTTERLLRAPLCTTISTPQDNAVDVALDTVVTWDASSGATTYLLSIGTTLGGVDVLDNEDVGDVLSYSTPTGYPENTTLYVTVTPSNSAGIATRCSGISFTTAIDSLECTLITSPINFSTEVDLQSRIFWTNVSRATGYRVSISTVSGTNNILNNFDVGNELSFQDASIIYPENTQIFVKVVPYNNLSTAVACNEIVFVTNSLPACTNITSPLNGSQSEELDLIVEWEEVSNALGYRISVGTTFKGVDVVDNVEVFNVTDFDLESFSLDYETVYYISVTPFNELGEAVNSCSEINFTTTLRPDDTKFGISPNGDNVNDFWQIDNIENFPDNEVLIYNRWGDLIFQTKTYNNRDNVFEGVANRNESKGASKLPDGTYFFQININGAHNLKKTRGFLVIKR